MSAIPISVQKSLSEIIHGLKAGEEVTITENEIPVAKITALPPPTASLQRRKLGGQRGTVLYMAPDFNAPMEDFKEYME